MLAANALISVTPGLMIWTIVCFLIALFVLKRFAFGPIQQAIDDRRDPIRGRRPDADRDREGHRQGARPRRPPQADRGRDRRPRLLGAREGVGLSVVHRTYARSLFEAAKEAGRVPAVRQDLGDFVEAGRQVPELDELLRNPQLDKRAKAAA